PFAAPGQRRLPAGVALDLRSARASRGAPRPRLLAEQVEQQIPTAMLLGGREYRGDAELLPIAAVTPQAHEVDQYAGAAEPGDQTPHACRADLPLSRKLSAAGSGAGRGDARRLA